MASVTRYRRRIKMTIQSCRWLLGTDTTRARVRPVNWTWVEYLQNLQREDLLQEVMERHESGGSDTISAPSGNTTPE